MSIQKTRELDKLDFEGHGPSRIHQLIALS